MRKESPASGLRALAAIVLVLLVGMLPSCGKSTTGPTTTSTTVPAGPGRVAVSQPSTAQLCFSPRSAFFFRLRLPVRFVESGGAGVNVNFVRFSLLRGATEVERNEVTSADLTAAGAQRVGANATVNATLSFDFNADPDTWDDVRFEFSFTDDRGNNSTATMGDITNLVLSLPVCTI
jgi:hypothetical protein